MSGVPVVLVVLPMLALYGWCMFVATRWMMGKTVLPFAREWFIRREVRRGILSEAEVREIVGKHWAP